ncbi:MAG: hypothetical protein M3R13_02190 [Armatimonadota bacterium]|nr:hypothetical protein [Armatimonadota bacterium]
MDIQTRHEDEILKLRQDVRELKTLNRRSAWISLFTYPLFVILVLAYARTPREEGLKLESGEIDVSTSLAQNRLIMSTFTSNLEVSNMGRPVIALSDYGARFALAIEDGKLIAVGYRGDGTEVTNVLVDGNLPPAK